MNERAIDHMSKEDIVAHLVRMASYLSTTFRLNEAQASYGMKSPTGAMAQGRREVCASILDDFAVNFGIRDGE